jgi:hypothetical protein
VGSRGSGEDTLAWIIGTIAILVVVAAVWFLFLEPI